MNIANTILTLNKLDIGYKRPIISNVTTSIESGSLIGLIGENGAGKSTLLKSIAKFIEKLSGDILINDKSIQNYSQIEFSKLLSIVTTQRISISHYKVEDVVAYGRYPHGNWTKDITSKDKDLVLKAINDVQANHLIGKLINELSDGEYQRIMIARCLAQDTPIILLDEPTAFLDLNGKYEIISLLQSLVKHQNKIIVFSSHDLTLAIKYVSKIWLLSNSQLIEETPEDLILKNQINKIIKTPILEFNSTTGDFECNFEFQYEIFVKGEEIVKKWTINALNKLGYNVTNSKSFPSLNIIELNNYYKWIYKQSNESVENEFYSVNDLSLFLKNLTKKQ
jgi:cobalamin transport system ATP-binding protein